ncbi:MAG: hypothetical protein IAG13_33415 [Deltaproteobacteria bacterium]|nr:hypothetical protein [Nannocystaceae bacterium]
MLAVSALGFVAACPGEGGDDGGESGASSLCAAQATVAECDVADGCLWDPDHEQCIIDCASIEDRSACLDTDECFWDGRACFYGAI